jgi:ABC-type amino acid transport substrate-binding protein
LVQREEYNALHLKWFGTAQPNPFPLCTKFYPLTPLADLAIVLEKQVVRQGIAVLGPPYSFTTAQNQLTGFDVELGLGLTEKVKQHNGLATLQHVFVISGGIPIILTELNQDKLTWYLQICP